VEIIVIGGWLWVIVIRCTCNTDSMTDVALMLLLLTAELVHEMIQLELRINQNRRRSLIVLGYADLVVIAEDAAFRRSRDNLGLELAL